MLILMSDSEEEALPPEDNYDAQNHFDRYNPSPSPPHASGGVYYNEPLPQGEEYSPQPPHDPAHTFPAGPAPLVDPYSYPPREAPREGGNVSSITPFAPQAQPPPPRALYNMSDEESRVGLMYPRNPFAPATPRLQPKWRVEDFEHCISSTISKDKTLGETARNSSLLEQFARKTERVGKGLHTKKMATGLDDPRNFERREPPPWSAGAQRYANFSTANGTVSKASQDAETRRKNYQAWESIRDCASLSTLETYTKRVYSAIG